MDYLVIFVARRHLVFFFLGGNGRQLIGQGLVEAYQLESQQRLTGFALEDDALTSFKVHALVVSHVMTEGSTSALVGLGKENGDDGLG